MPKSELHSSLSLQAAARKHLSIGGQSASSPSHRQNWSVPPPRLGLANEALNLLELPWQDYILVSGRMIVRVLCSPLSRSAL